MIESMNIHYNYQHGLFDITSDDINYSLMEDMYTRRGNMTWHGEGLQIIKGNESDVLCLCNDVYKAVNSLAVYLYKQKDDKNNTTDDPWMPPC